jgi:hypothetical protein
LHPLIYEFLHWKSDKTSRDPGEIITDVECKRRMEEAKHKGEPHFYMMELQQGLIIDARDKGTVARLINSCCDPNAQSQKWHDARTGADPDPVLLLLILPLKVARSAGFCGDIWWRH